MKLYSRGTPLANCTDQTKILLFRHTSSLPVHGEASAKTELYRERFMLLRQRVSRAEHFSRPTFDAGMSQFENDGVGLSFLSNVFVVPISFWVLKLKLKLRSLLHVLPSRYLQSSL